MFKIIFRNMDSFELNKIIAAVLMVALLVIGIGKLSNIIFHVEKPKTPGYAVEVEQATTVSSSVETAVVEKIDIVALMAMGDIAVGEKVFKKCDIFISKHQKTHEEINDKTCLVFLNIQNLMFLVPHSF